MNFRSFLPFPSLQKSFSDKNCKLPSLHATRLENEPGWKTPAPLLLLHMCVGTFFGQDTISRELHTSTMNNEPGFINDRSILDKQGHSKSWKLSSRCKLLFTFWFIPIWLKERNFLNCKEKCAEIINRFWDTN